VLTGILLVLSEIAILTSIDGWCLFIDLN
jgi:hypothetical protein